MPNPRLYPKLSNRAIVQSKGFDPSVPSPLSQAYSRRMIEQQVADQKLKDMKLSPLDKAVAGLEAVAMAGSAMFEAIQQAPKLLQGEDAYAQAIGNRMYMPRKQPEKAMEYLGNTIDMLDRLQTEYKLPPILPELAGLAPLMTAANQQATQNVKRGALQAGTAVERALDKPVTNIMNRGGMGAELLGSFNAQPAQVVKPKGGNWLTGNVEKQLGRMKMADYTPPENLAEQQKAIDTAKRIVGNDPQAQRQIQAMEQELEVSKRNNAINQWIDSNLTNYVKKQMGTPEDPVRKLAEEDVLHIKPIGDQYQVSSRLMNKRKGAGFNPLGEGKNEAARFWERQADISLEPYPAGSYKHGALDESLLEANPWLKNVPDEEMIYYSKGLNDLGFDHIIDVLRQDVREGRIRPEQLNKVSMEQAVRRTYEFDQEQAKKMREAAIKQTEGFPVHKEYPEEGYKWIELKAPDYNSLPLEERKQMIARLTEEARQKGLTPEDYIEKYPESQLAEALKYEGDTMGHCVGGYCPDVLSGQSRIYSLRDKRGEPHVTVEVNPSPHPISTSRRGDDFPELSGFEYGGKYSPESPYKPTKEELKKVYDRAYELWSQKGTGRASDIDTFAQQASNEILGPMPSAIRQIKGKQNAAPKADYLPYVQDFVRSGEWSDVGDLRNTGLIKQDGKYMTQAEYDDYLLNELKPPEPPVEGMKAGGAVNISDNPDTMMMELEDQKFAVGGAAIKRVLAIADHAERAKKATELLTRMATSGQVDADAQRALLKAQSGARALPTVLPRAKPKTKDQIRGYAQRTADQLNAAQQGQFLRADPTGASENAAGKSKKLWEMEQGLTHDIRPLGLPLDPIKTANIEDQLGMLKLGISGDTSISDQKLYRAGQYGLQSASEQQGGPYFGLRRRPNPAAWASNVPVLENVQKDIGEFSRAYGDVPVLGQYNSMGSQGTNFAQHFADANLEAIANHGLTPDQAEQLNNLIKKGNKKSGVHADFPGVEDPAGAYFYFSFYPELRKHFNDIMTKPDYTSKLGLPDGRVILHAITDPELRDMPVLTSGKAQYQLVPSQDPKNLPLSEHSTYTHNLPRDPDAPVTQTPFPIPAEFEFSDVTEYAKPRYNPSDMTRVLQTASPRQIIDQQHIDEIKAYEDFMRQYSPQSEKKKAGGLIKVQRKAGGGIIKKAIKAAKAVEAPTTKRLEMSFKDVTKPVPELTEAAQKLKAGKLSREEYEALVSRHKPVTPYSFVPQPATAEDANRALNVSQRTKFGKVQDITPGTPTGLRLDINAYKDHGVWVNSIHPKDMPTTYNNVSSVTNAEMVMPEEKALEVATREKNKSPFAVIKGGWNPINEEEAVARATEYLNHPDWVQVGIDPERHGYYYNRATMEPIVRAEEVIQIGPLVLAKKPVTAPKESFKYARGGAVNANDLILTERPL